jgi:hypothetical protein
MSSLTKRRALSKTVPRRGARRPARKMQMVDVVKPPTAPAPIAGKTIPVPAEQPALVEQPARNDRKFHAPSWKTVAGALGAIGLAGGLAYGANRLRQHGYGGVIRAPEFPRGTEGNIPFPLQGVSEADIRMQHAEEIMRRSSMGAGVGGDLGSTSGLIVGRRARIDRSLRPPLGTELATASLARGARGEGVAPAILKQAQSSVSMQDLADQLANIPTVAQVQEALRLQQQEARAGQDLRGVFRGQALRLASRATGGRLPTTLRRSGTRRWPTVRADFTPKFS